MSTATPSRRQLRTAIDRHGADLARWPDASLANLVRAAVLSDPALRRHRDEAAALERRLGALRNALDDAIARSGAVERVTRAVLADLPRRRGRNAWVAIAAALVLAAGLGSIIDLNFLAPAADEPVEVVVLDPLVFGPTEAETR